MSKIKIITEEVALLNFNSTKTEAIARETEAWYQHQLNCEEPCFTKDSLNDWFLNKGLDGLSSYEVSNPLTEYWKSMDKLSIFMKGFYLGICYAKDYEERQCTVSNPTRRINPDGVTIIGRR